MEPRNPWNPGTHGTQEPMEPRNPWNPGTHGTQEPMEPRNPWNSRLKYLTMASFKAGENSTDPGRRA
jgi:hypothetical protein